MTLRTEEEIARAIMAEAGLDSRVVSLLLERAVREAREGIVEFSDDPEAILQVQYWGKNHGLYDGSLDGRTISQELLNTYKEHHDSDPHHP